MLDRDVDLENSLAESLDRSGLVVERQLPQGCAGANTTFRARQLNHLLADAKVTFKEADEGLSLVPCSATTKSANRIFFSKLISLKFQRLFIILLSL